MTTKERVLQTLTAAAQGSLQSAPDQAPGSSAYVSGESLAAACGTSRTAVWKAVNALRRDGYDIAAVTNRGYRLGARSDVFDTAAVYHAINEDFAETAAVADRRTAGSTDKSAGLSVFPRSYIRLFQKIDSTNTECKRLAADVPSFRDAHGGLTPAGAKLHRSFVAAACQTAGRGRMGRPFYSPDQHGVYLSIIYAPEHGVTNPALMTATASVGVCRALKVLYGVEPQIKWVNDIFLGGRKVCGILTEGVMSMERGAIEAAIVGIGVNISERASDFPEEITGVAGSILEVSEKNAAALPHVSRAQLVARIVYEVLRIYDGGESAGKDALAEYRARSLILGQTLQVSPVIGDEKSVYTARAVAVDDEAHLVVELPDGSRKTLQSGEVTLRSASFAARG